MQYQEHITPDKIIGQRRKIEEAELKEEASRRAALQRSQEKAAAIAQKLSPAVDKSLSVWPILFPFLKEQTKTTFDIIASHVGADYICAGSYPAAMLTGVRNAQSDSIDKLKLLFNDVDIYHGTFGCGTMHRGKCT